MVELPQIASGARDIANISVGEDCTDDDYAVVDMNDFSSAEHAQVAADHRARRREAPCRSARAARPLLRTRNT